MAMRLRTPAARPVFLALLAATAWFVWGTGTAQAATPATDAEVLVQPAGPDIADSSPAAVTAIVPGTVATVSGPVPALPEPPPVQALLPLPLPGTVPLPGLPALLPAAARTHLPGVVRLPTPAHAVVPLAAPGRPASSTASDASAAAPLTAPEPRDGTTGASADGVPLAQTGGGASNARSFGLTPAQDRAGSAVHARASLGLSVPAGPAETPGLLPTSAVLGHAGHHGSASFGGFGGAADMADSWPALPTAASAPNRPEAETIPASPTFDPGATPD